MGCQPTVQQSRRFPLCGRGDVNTYTVFAEAMREAVGGFGRAGVIVPSGIATDDTTKHFFSDLVEQGSLVSLYDFENALPMFLDVHRSFRFCLLTLTGKQRPVDAAAFMFFAHSTPDLADENRRFVLGAEDFRLLNPNSRTCPVFRTKRDAELNRRLYARVPVLRADATSGADPWGVRLTTQFHMTNDSGLFRTRSELEAEGWHLAGNVFQRSNERFLPTYEGKMTAPFDHRASDIVLNPANAARQQQSRPLTPAEHRDPGRVAQPYLWASSRDVESRDDNSAGFWPSLKRVTASTNWRTAIAAIVPAHAISYTLYLCQLSDASRGLQLTSLLNSFVFDYLLRAKTSQPSLPIGVIEETAAVHPDSFSGGAIDLATGGLGVFIDVRAFELTYTSWDLEPVARMMLRPRPPFVWDEGRRSVLAAELDACFFHLYGLERADTEFVLEAFPIIKRRDEAAFGDYRTKRLILEVHDAMADAIASGKPYQTILDPPPADPSLCHPESTRPDWAKA
jgi:hypothetical protein